MNHEKKYLGYNVLEAARGRISWVFDTFPKICVSFSGGKDSTVVLHLVAEEARKRNRKIYVLFVDWEAQYKITIDHVLNMFSRYNDIIIPYWVALPLKTVNATSQIEPEWIAWDRDKKSLWVRNPPEIAITNFDTFPFYTYAMTFEEFVPSFEKWISSDGSATAMFVGIRTGESLNRWRTIFSESKGTYEGNPYTTRVGDLVCRVFPIYDWSDSDIWVFHNKTALPHNNLYDLMYQAGLPLKNMRICEPYGSEQRQGLWLYHIIEPESWGKLVARVSGANMGALYAKTRGNILGINQIELPTGHTWKSFALSLLDSMPVPTSEHYKNKIAIYLKWYLTRGYPEGIPDQQDGDCGSTDLKPSWKRICKVLLRNDYWCHGLSFSPTKTSAYNKYLQLMKKRREEWNLI